MKKELLIRIAYGLIGVIIGLTFTVGVWHYKDIYKYKLLPTSQGQVNEFNDEFFWDNVVAYYEDELDVFLDNYYSIYNTYSLSTYLENSLTPYYDEYGYDVIISSGLQSGNKMAQSYCIEKCCELIGEEKLNKPSILKLLEHITIDEQCITDYDEEKEYIELAKERLAIAKALFSNDIDSDKIHINENKSRMAWVSKAFANDCKIRISDNNYFYTLEESYMIIPTEISFLNNNTLKIITDYKSQLIYFKEKIYIYDLESKIYECLNEENADNVELYGSPEIKKIICKDEIAIIKYNIIRYDNEKEEMHTISLNMRNGQATINNGLEMKE